MGKPDPETVVHKGSDELGEKPDDLGDVYTPDYTDFKPRTYSNTTWGWLPLWSGPTQAEIAEDRAAFEKVQEAVFHARKKEEREQREREEREERKERERKAIQDMEFPPSEDDNNLSEGSEEEESSPEDEDNTTEAKSGTTPHKNACSQLHSWFESALLLFSYPTQVPSTAPAATAEEQEPLLSSPSSKTRFKCD